MATTIAEQIARKVRTRLQAISTGSGYEASVSDVIRTPRMATHRPRDYQITVEQRGMTPNPQLSCPGSPPAQAYDLTFAVIAEFRPSDDDLTPIDTYRNQFHGDCVKAICTGASWHNWDGLALNTRLGPVNAVTNESIVTGFVMQFVVMFRVDENNPFNAR